MLGAQKLVIEPVNIGNMLRYVTICYDVLQTFSDFKHLQTFSNIFKHLQTVLACSSGYRSQFTKFWSGPQAEKAKTAMPKAAAKDPVHWRGVRRGAVEC